MKIICSVYDNKAKVWATPFYAHSEVTALRDFAAAAHGNTVIAQFPADYELWKIGGWDDQKGDLLIFEHTYLGRADDLISKEV